MSKKFQPLHISNYFNCVLILYLLKICEIFLAQRDPENNNKKPVLTQKSRQESWKNM